MARVTREIGEIPIAIAFDTRSGETKIYTTADIRQGMGHGRRWEYVVILDQNVAQHLDPRRRDEFLAAMSSMSQNHIHGLSPSNSSVQASEIYKQREREREIGRSVRGESIYWAVYDEFTNHIRPSREEQERIEIARDQARKHVQQMEAEMRRQMGDMLFESTTRARSSGNIPRDQMWSNPEPPPRETIELKPGTKVHYLPKAREGKDDPENGIIKSIPKDNQGAVFVVYHCNNDWDNYKDYTANLTKLTDLKIGWVE